MGHNHPAVIQSIQDTLASGLPLHTLDLTTPLKMLLLKHFGLNNCQAVKKNIAYSSVDHLVQMLQKRRLNLLQHILVVVL